MEPDRWARRKWRDRRFWPLFQKALLVAGIVVWSMLGLIGLFELARVLTVRP